MKKGVWKIIMLLFALSMAGCQSSKQEEAGSTKVPEEGSILEEENTTAMVIFLPDDSNKVWKDEWLDSETNVEVVWTGAPKQGKLSIKLCYPDTVDVSERDDSFELFLDGVGKNFTVRDSLEEGTLGEGWKSYTFESEYQIGNNELEILLKTHSKKGSQGIDFAIADLTVTDADTGAVRKADLFSEDVRICFKQGNFIAGQAKEYEYELKRIGKKTMEAPDPTATLEPTNAPDPTATPKPTEKPEATTAPKSTKGAEPTATLKPTKGAEPTAIPKPTKGPEPTATPKPTEAPKPTKAPIADGSVLEHTGVIIALPDDSKNKWKNDWEESETNISIDYCSEELPKKGVVTLKLCYLKKDFLSRDENFEVGINNQWKIFHISEASERGSLNRDWNYVEVTMEYTANNGELSILLKTHSGAGSRGTLFGVADIVITDSSSNRKHYLDLTKENVKLACKKGNFFEGGLLDCSYRISDMQDNKVLYEAGDLNEEIPEVSAKYEQDSKLYCLTYKLPESDTKWKEAWEESEANIIFYYLSNVPLSSGTVYASVCVPKGLTKEREDSFELAVHGVTDFYNYNSDGVTVTYQDGSLYADNRQVEEEEDCYRIKLKVDYDNSMVGYENELLFYFKSHCTEISEAYEVTICDVVVEDKREGSIALDLSASNVWVEGKMYRTGETVDFTLSDSIFDFYIVNEVRKIAEGATHVLEVYNSDGTPVSFKSSDRSIASVDSNGKITAHKKGSCEITAIKESTGESKSFTLTVSSPQVVLTDYEVFMLVGSEAHWEAETEYTKSAGEYTFKSTNASVASVDSTGLVKAKQEGTTVIVVTDTVNQVECSVELVVYKPEDTNGIAKYLSIRNTNYVTADIAKRSYQLLYDVYKNVFDYFNYGEYEEVTLFFTVNDYSPAYSNSQDVYLASEHMLANAKDVDCITHELIHCAQNHISVGDYVWLMEGLTDYGRYLFGLHNEDCGWRLPTPEETGHYTDGYTGTAAFLKFVTENYCEDMPHIINKMFKGVGGYDDSIWKKNTGYTIDELWELYSNK